MKKINKVLLLLTFIISLKSFGQFDLYGKWYANSEKSFYKKKNIEIEEIEFIKSNLEISKLEEVLNIKPEKYSEILKLRKEQNILNNFVPISLLNMFERENLNDFSISIIKKGIFKSFLKEPFTPNFSSNGDKGGNKKESFNGEFILVNSFYGKKLILIPEKDNVIIYDIDLNNQGIESNIIIYSPLTYFTRKKERFNNKPISVNKRNSDWNSEGLFGSPKRVLTIRNFYQEDIPKKYTTTRSTDFKEIIFDKKGKKISEINFGMYTQNDSKLIYNYDKKKTIISNKSLDNKKGLPEYIPDSIISTKNLNEKINKGFKNGEISFISKISLINGRENIIKLYNKEQKITSIIKKEFDEKGKFCKRIKMIMKGNTTTDIKLKEYLYLEFDNKGNWTKRILKYYIQGKIDNKFLETRKIYY